ncbi:MAG: hypothetical protein LLF93_07335 [Bacteroidales bacterium]|nr:hypothetical protein [Bacteroidales bacterium]
MNRSIFLLFIILLAGSLVEVRAQNSSQKYLKAEELRRSYKFKEAIEIYKELISETQDTSFLKTLTIQVARSENGLSMLEYSTRPIALGSVTVPKYDFYLYIPGIPDSSWTAVPSSMDKRGAEGNPKNAILLRGIPVKIFFSSVNARGRRDIYQTSLVGDNTWSAPEPLNNNINSAGDEILPILSPGGKELYFASNGQYGMGGFDLYMSTWDEKINDWGIPQNLGFPYSSPADDLMFINSDDGLYTFIASNRDVASADSISIYKLQYESTPVKSSIDSSVEAFNISRLLPAGSKPKKETEGTVRTSPEIDGYSSMVKSVRQIQLEIDKTIGENSRNRELYSGLTESSEKTALEKKITQGEIRLIEQQEQLRSANLAIQKREMDFLSKGLIIPRSDDFLKDSVSTPNAEPIINFEVEKHSLGSLPEMIILDPVVAFDYNFRVGTESEIAEDNLVSDELIYRIQLSVQTERANKKSFKGISPVFERKTPTGKWLYSAGQFYNYEEMSKALVKVKSLGFRTAIGVAYQGGKSVTIKNARLLESKVVAKKTYQLKLENYPNEIPQFLLDIIRKNTDKDIARKPVNGKTLFFIGPYANRTDAEILLKLLSDSGAEGVSIEEIKAE